MVKYVQEYIRRKSELGTRHDAGNSAFFISYKAPHKPVGASTLAQWVVSVMASAGINVSVFKAHSTRRAGTSAAKGLVTIEAILRIGGWSSASTFAKFFDRRVDSDLSLGTAIASRFTGMDK